ncbi:MAG TPA: hypothetical protein PK443_01095 [bacterium]|jgi:uncharacterized integral membrane protein|nr:hypothetical protein [bacterium]
MKTFGILFYFLFVIAITVLGVFFAKHNSEPIITRFFYLRTDPTAQWIVMLVSFLFGFITATLMLTWKLIAVYVSRKKYMKSYEQVKAVLEQKIKDLKIDGQE